MSGLWFSTACRHCGGELEQVNDGHADGCRSYWVGACRACRRQWVVIASIVPVPSRGQGMHA